MADYIPPGSLPPGPRLLTREDVQAKVNAALVEGFRLQDLIFSRDEKDIAERRKLFKDNPEEVRHQLQFFFRYLDRVWPARILHETVNPQRKRISPEDIAALKLTPEQLRKLAGIEEIDAE